MTQRWRSLRSYLYVAWEPLPAWPRRLVAAVAVVALTCLGGGLIVLSRDGPEPAPPAQPSGVVRSGQAPPTRPLAARSQAAQPAAEPEGALCRRRALGAGDEEGPAKRDFAPRCVLPAHAAPGGDRASP
jgi:hypothetical protein